MREYLINTYLDYENKYLLVATWAEHNGLTEAQAEVIINLGHELFNTPHPDE